MNYQKDLKPSANRVSGSNQPLVSVIIPAYNASCFIERTLHSALNQTYQNLEVIVIDDGSTDNTRQIVQAIAATDSRLSYYPQTNAGVAVARNHGIERAKGEFIAPLDADDLWHRTNLAQQVSLLANADDKVGMVYSWSVDIDADDCLTGNVRVSPFYGNVYPPLFYANVVGNGSACLIRRSCFRHVGGYNDEFRAQRAEGCEDWDIYLRIAEHYYVMLVPELLVGYRQAGGSMSTHANVMDKSQELAFEKISRQYPQVYREVRRWAASVNAIYELSQHLQAHRHAQAWEALRKALQADVLIVLTTYINWVMMFSLIAQMIAARLQSAWVHLLKRPLKEDSTASLGRTLPNGKGAIPLEGFAIATIISKIGTGARLLLSPLFPAWIIRELRMRWLSAKVSPHQPGSQTLSPWRVSRARLLTRLRAEQSKRPVDFSQSPIPTGTHPSQRPPINAASAVQK
jgi:glycosyltransferase involved in cell wall biosynthesis